MHICLQMDAPLQGPIVEKFDPIALDIESAAHFADFIQESDHIEVLRAFNKNAPFGADGCHAPGGRFNAVRDDCMLHFIKSASALDADGPIDIEGDDGSKLLQEQDELDNFRFDRRIFNDRDASCGDAG